MSSYIDFRTEPITESEHVTIVNGLTVTCDNLFCSYEETFTSYDDAIIAAEIHQES